MHTHFIVSVTRQFNQTTKTTKKTTNKQQQKHWKHCNKKEEIKEMYEQTIRYL